MNHGTLAESQPIGIRTAGVGPITNRMTFANIVIENLLYVLFLGFLGTVYISNVHYAENTVREIKALEEEISDLRWQYMAQKAELMYSSKHSEVLGRVHSIGLTDKGHKPNKIVVNDTWIFDENHIEEDY